MSDATDAFREGLAEGLKIAVRHLESRINAPGDASQALQDAILCFNAGIAAVNQ